MNKVLYLVIAHLIDKKAEGAASFGIKGHLVAPCAEPEAEKDTAQDKSAIDGGYIFPVGRASGSPKKGNDGQHEVVCVASVDVMDGADVFEEHGNLVVPAIFPAGHMQTQIRQNDLIVVGSY